MEDKCKEPMRGHGKFRQCLWEWQQEVLGDKRQSVTRKGNIFSLLNHHHAPKADKVIQEADDVKVQLACLNTGLVEFHWKVEVARATKAKQQWDWKRLADEQAKQDQHMEAEEKAEREQQEQQAELAHVNWEVSPN